jgi:hypothetical protein
MNLLFLKFSPGNFQGPAGLFKLLAEAEIWRISPTAVSRYLPCCGWAILGFFIGKERPA